MQAELERSVLSVQMLGVFPFYPGLPRQITYGGLGD
jgi:hypothetical protein